MWREKGACWDTALDVFFPNELGGTQAKEAKAICNGCAVKRECLEFALRHKAFELEGIWGGSSKMERRNIRHGRMKVSDLEVHAA